jgi:cytochrome P450
VEQTYRSLGGPRTAPLVTSLYYGFLPQRFAERHAAEFGRSYLLRAKPVPYLVTSDPEHLRRIFAADSDTFRTLAAVTLRNVFGPRSVLLTHGAPHRQQRKLLGPPLTGARLRGFGASMQAMADAQVAALRPGQIFKAHALALRFTLDVIVRTVFGVTSDEEATEACAMLSALVEDLPPISIFVPQTQHAWFPPWARYQRRQRAFDSWLSEVVRRRRAQAVARDDVLSLLLAARYDDGRPIDDQDIHDQLLTLLMAGHETTAIAVTRCLERIYHHDAVLGRLQSELREAGETIEETQRLPYLSAVIDECLRIDPIVTDVARVATRPFDLGGGLILPEGAPVLVLVEALHRDPLLYPEPARFRPERFLERKFQPHEYAPFGGGVRRCLGAAFSDYESKILLSTLLRRRSLMPVHRGLSHRVRRNITMGPAHAVPFRVMS